ncbi:hypothetical protein [Chryseobacterium sp.]|uniref:hypothetical protein n=1 Tax=Chryseobacterium sp. TaxID=1871047 RepID=UPI0035C6E0EC
MKKLFLFSVLVFLWNCGANSKKEITRNKEMDWSIKNYKATETPAKFNIVADTDCYLTKKNHDITEPKFDSCIASFHKKRNYKVHPLLNDEDFMNKINDLDNQNKFIKIKFGNNQNADDFEYTIVDRFNFKDCESYYNVCALKKFVGDNAQNMTNLIVTKGKERIVKTNEYVQESGDYVEALFALELNNGKEYLYYNLSHIPPKK